MRIAFGRKLLQLILQFMHLASFFALMVMMLTVVANIIGQIFFKAPIMGTLEIAGFCGVVFVSASVGLAQRERRNIYVDIVVQRFSTGWRRISDSFTYFLSLLAVGILCWAVTDSAIEAFIDDDVTITLSVKTFPFRGIWAIGLLILSILLVKHLFEFLRGGAEQ
jgi:TRAP-type C4-dicarboxylate transport system permease small subunit